MILVAGVILLLLFLCHPSFSLVKPMMLYDAMPVVAMVADAVKERAKHTRDVAQKLRQQELRERVV